MIVRRLLTGMLFFGLAVPALAAAPRSSHAQQPIVRAVPAEGGSRVLSRAAPDEAVAAGTLPSPPASTAPSAAPESSPSPELTAKARAEFDAWENGKIDRSRYTTHANAQMTDALVAEVAARLKPSGEIKALTPLRETTAQGMQIHVYRVSCANGPALEELISWDSAGKIQLIYFRPEPS